MGATATGPQKRAAKRQTLGNITTKRKGIYINQTQQTAGQL